jgi:penicillin-binding protein 1C
MRHLWHSLTRTRRRKLALVLLVLLLIGGGFIYSWIFAGLPSLDQLEAGMALPATRIYDRNGTLLYEIQTEAEGANRVIPLSEIPQTCVQAVVATEDANYYSHAGIDLVGIARAVWINLKGGEVIAGGSTITQQTARLLLLDPLGQSERTLQRKLKEVVLALQLNGLGKERVLELYLNQVYFGNLAYGIEAAARTYFNKSAPDLSLAECAMMAGIVQNAIANDPLAHPQAARERQQVVLRLMTQNGSISAEQAASAEKDELQFGASPFPIEAPHFVMAVWEQLEHDYPEALHAGGLDVVTTLDLNWQKIAQGVAQQQLRYLNNPPLFERIPANANNAAIVALDPYTGQVLTMLGSPDYFDESIDGAVNAAMALRQPGSALKPFTYAAAMNPESPEPYTAATVLLDVETPFITRRLESYTPANFGQVEHGPVRIREALASSYNIPAVLALEHVGIQPFLQFVGDAGLENLSHNPDVDLAVTLGGGEVRLIDLTGAYSIFVNGGYRVKPTMLLKITDQQGKVLYNYEPPPLTQKVVDERVAYIITDILSDNTARQPSFGPVSPLKLDRPSAAKTGTTTDFRDNWVVGYTPNLVVGVWVGNVDNTMMREVTGVSGAGPIYNLFMREILLGQPKLEFQRPDGLTQVDVCALSGKLPTPACPLTHREWFIPGTEPTEPDTWYQVYDIDKTTGRLATADTPRENVISQTYIVLPQEARQWGIRKGLRLPPTEGDVVLTDDTGGLRLLEPDPYTTFQISPTMPIESQRLKLTVGVAEGTQSVTYLMDGQSIGTVTASPWVVWWPLALGSHELIAQAQMSDGTTQTSAAIPFSVVEYEENRGSYNQAP